MKLFLYQMVDLFQERVGVARIIDCDIGGDDLKFGGGGPSNTDSGAVGADADNFSAEVGYRHRLVIEATIRGNDADSFWRLGDAMLPNPNPNILADRIPTKLASQKLHEESWRFAADQITRQFFLIT